MSPCTKVPVGCARLTSATYATSDGQRRDFWERRLGEGEDVSGEGRGGSLSLCTRAPSNRKNVIIGRIKVRETTFVTRLRRRLRRRRSPDAEFKYRRKYSAFDSRNCCIRHLFPLDAATQRVVRCCRLSSGRRLKGDERAEERNKGVIHCQHLPGKRPLKVYTDVLKSSPFPLFLVISKGSLKNIRDLQRTGRDLLF